MSAFAKNGHRRGDFADCRHISSVVEVYRWREKPRHHAPAAASTLNQSVGGFSAKARCLTVPGFTFLE